MVESTFCASYAFSYATVLCICQVVACEGGASRELVCNRLSEFISRNSFDELIQDDTTKMANKVFQRHMYTSI